MVANQEPGLLPEYLTSEQSGAKRDRDPSISAEGTTLGSYGSLDCFEGCLLGLAIGDAVGTTLEFRARGSFAPITDMVGGGSFGLLPGQWTDDTSMALCLATSLVERRGVDPADQMDRYCRWWREGYLSSTGSCFDIGRTTAAALQRYLSSGDPFSGSKDPGSAGNGSLMRLAPIPIWFYPDADGAARYARESSRTTHGAAECLDACELFSRQLILALSGAPKEVILLRHGAQLTGSPALAEIAGGGYMDKESSEIESSGYVVHTLEAALWAFHTTATFEEAVLAAANLGDDADTTACVCGQLAGAFYGRTGIPERWLRTLAMGSEIAALAHRLRSE